jgi:hypothetical protein
MIVAVVGLGLAVGHPQIVELLEPPPPPTAKLTDALVEAGDKLVEKVVNRVRGKKPAPAPAAEPPAAPPAKPRWPLYLSIAATSLGFFGSLSGTIGWIRREDHRLAGATVAIGGVAVAWMYIVAALAMAITMVILFVIVRIFHLG